MHLSSLYCVQILRQHDAELKELERRFDVEKGHQVQALRDKLAEKRRRKLEEQQRKHKVEVSKETLEQKKELAEVRTKQVSHCIWQYTNVTTVLW